jgi:uncharacterized protein
VRSALVDSGALVALFDTADRQFEHYRRLFGQLLDRQVRLATTWPCVTEASYLLAPRNHMAMLDWLGSRAVVAHDFDATDLSDMLEWMRKYTERGKSLMDFADASVYWLATRLESNIVLSVDKRDFGRYRLPDGTAFEVL